MHGVCILTRPCTFYPFFHARGVHFDEPVHVLPPFSCTGCNGYKKIAYLCIMKRIAVILAAIVLADIIYAQTPIVAPNFSEPTMVSTEYFGPNAFPVPDMTDGRVKPYVYAEIAADYYKGRIADGNDHTWDGFLRLSFPLWTKRATLEIWGPVVEHWKYSDAVADYRRIGEARSQTKSWDSGDIYIGTNIHLLQGKSNTFKPDILVRAVLKSAMGNTFEQARYYDCGGYIFDGTIAWSRSFTGSYLCEVRAGFSGGFLCWQDGLARQNDAVMYGLFASIYTWGFTFTADYSGYIGWENDGDRPRRLRLKFEGNAGRWRPFLQYTRGMKNYPFDGFRLGLGYCF